MSREWRNQPAVLHQLVRAELKKAPDAAAAIYDGVFLTNRELMSQADAWAAHLRHRGVERGTLVGVHLERSLTLPALILGILQAGGVCVPLEPEHPQDTLATMIGEARLTLILTDSRLRHQLPVADVPVVAIDAEPPLPAAALVTDVSESDLAFVFYTSGSTGLPKGVMLSHAAVAARMVRPEAEIPTAGSCMTILKTAISHSPFLGEMFTPLLHGCYFAIARPGGYQDTPYLGGLMQEHQVSHIAMTSSVLRTFLEWPGAAGCRALTAVYVGGEAVTEELRKRFHERFPAAKFFVTYGTSESGHMLSGECGSTQPINGSRIGRPIENATVHLLDTSLEPVPLGEIGEMYLGGPRLASGYLHRPNWTAERFLLDPRSADPAARLFRSGDLGRQRPDGELEFHGRVDDQVKILGHRVELAEIEAAIAPHPDVLSAVVIARVNDRGDTQLAAYTVPKQQPALDPRELRRWLRERLPPYMVPQHFITLDKLPLTAIGKVDRAALPAPTVTNRFANGAVKNSSLPRDDAESLIVSVFQRLLEIDRPGVYDDFFALGGHSLLAVEVIMEINRLGNFNLGVGDLIRNPSAEQLAEILRGAEREQRPSLIPLCENSGQDKLFCIMGIQLYHDLAYALHDELSVYAVLVPVESQVLEQIAAGDKDAAFPSVEELASQYIGVIREAQPNGPYHLLGLSFGGVVAFEIARQLQQQGEQTNFLALLDAALPCGKRRKKVRWLKRRLREVLTLPTAALHHFARREAPAKDANRLVWRARSDAAQQSAKLQWCQKRYRYRGPVTLFRAPADEYHGDFIYLPDYGWKEFVAGQVEPIDVTGDHRTMMRFPHAENLARIITAQVHRSVSDGARCAADAASSSAPSKSECFG